MNLCVYAKTFQFHTHGVFERVFSISKELVHSKADVFILKFRQIKPLNIPVQFLVPGVQLLVVGRDLFRSIPTLPKPPKK